MFDKARCIRNIYALAKQKSLKIGDLEEKAGVSKGYLSRINKEESTSSPSIEVLDSVSRQLDVGIDYLVNFSEEGLSENEEFVLKFVDKLMRMTLANKVEWQIESYNILTAENKMPVENPLVDVTKEYTDVLNQWYDTHVYRSGIYSESNVCVVDDCFHADVLGGTVYLNAVGYAGKETTSSGDSNVKRLVEVYIGLDKKTIKPICSTFFVAEEIRNAVLNLYEAVASAPSKIALDDQVKSVMNSIINFKEM